MTPRVHLKILLLHNFYRQAGGEDAVFRMEADLLRNRGHEVVTHTLHNDSIGGAGRIALASKTMWNHKAKVDIEELLAQGEFDIVHAHNLFPLYSPAIFWARRSAHTAFVQTLHNYRLICPSAILWRDGSPCTECVGRSPLPGIVHRCYRSSASATTGVATMLTLHRMLGTWESQVDRFIALTDFAMAKFIDGGIPASKLVVKPNFLSPDPGVGNEQSRNGVLYVGRLVPEKGLNTLLRAWRELPEIGLKIVGEGPMAAEIERRISEWSLTDNVQLLGRGSSDEVHQLMKSSAVLAFPSIWYEGFPITLVEALACGTPVVGSNLGSIGEIVTDGRTGRLFAAGDPRDLAKKVKTVLADGARLVEMSANCRAEYEAKYQTEQNYEALLSIYEQAIEERRSGRASTA